MQCCDTGPPFVKTACAMHAVLPYKGYLWDMAGVILGLVVQIARPRLAPALRPVAATARAELSLRADGIAPLFLPATLPLRVLSSEALSFSHSPSWIMGPCDPQAGLH